jgi:hypothetical protein
MGIPCWIHQVTNVFSEYGMPYYLPSLYRGEIEKRRCGSAFEVLYSGATEKRKCGSAFEGLYSGQTENRRCGTAYFHFYTVQETKIQSQTTNYLH